MLDAGVIDVALNNLAPAVGLRVADGKGGRLHNDQALPAVQLKLVTVND
jgi:hypothetical protein